MITVNAPPTANAGPDQTVTIAAGQTSINVALNGSGSSDPNGTVASYNWTGTPDPANTVSPTVTLTAGSYTFSLVVTDNNGANSAADTVVITVKLAPNQPPTANAGPDQTVTIAAGQTSIAVTLNGSGSSDPNGTIASYNWTGTPDPANTVSPTVTLAAGTYTFSLVVTDNNGANSAADTLTVEVDLPMEVGELLVNDEWQRVDFQTPFTDPIVVASALSGNDGDPPVVRVYGVDPEGFWIRVQEWGYLDGKHANEAVTYTAMERGRHQLPDGAWVEAGRLAKGTIAFAATTFSEPFGEVPVVFSTVTSVNEADAVVTRMRQISVTGFQVRMQEQEVNRQKHLPESVDYIAWEPSFGVVNGLRYEVGRMGAGVSSKVTTLVYQAAFAQPPMFLADMQTTNGGDPANLRWLNRNDVAVEVWVSEEQSKDAETVHTAESVGYFAADEEQ